MARARISLPVPLSPVMRTLTLVAGDAAGELHQLAHVAGDDGAGSPSRGRSSTGQSVARSSRSFLACSSSFRATSINRSAWTVATASIWGFTLSSITEGRPLNDSIWRTVPVPVLASKGSPIVASKLLEPSRLLMKASAK